MGLINCLVNANLQRHGSAFFKPEKCLNIFCFSTAKSLLSFIPLPVLTFIVHWCSFLFLCVLTLVFCCLYRPEMTISFPVPFSFGFYLCVSAQHTQPCLNYAFHHPVSFLRAISTIWNRRERIHSQHLISIIIQNLCAQTFRKEWWFNSSWWKCLFLIYFNSTQGWKIILKSTWLNNVFKMSVEQKESGYVWNHMPPHIKVLSMLQTVLAKFSIFRISNTE